MSRTVLKVAAGVLAISVVSVGVAYAAIPAEDGTITACYQRHAGLFDPKGALRVVDDASECRSGETVLTWDQNGAPGPAGPAGPQGAPGPQGPAGPPGGLAGYQVVQEESSMDDSDVKVVFADCPQGTMPVGGGGIPHYPGHGDVVTGVAISESLPTGDSWRVRAVEIPPGPPLHDGMWSITAVVTCAVVS